MLGTLHLIIVTSDSRLQVASDSRLQVTLLETDIIYSENENFLSFKPTFQADLLTASESHHTNDFTTMTVFLVYKMKTPLQNPVNGADLDFKTNHNVRKTKAAMKEAQMQAQLTAPGHRGGGCGFAERMRLMKATVRGLLAAVLVPRTAKPDADRIDLVFKVKELTAGIGKLPRIIVRDGLLCPQ
jgi:hypothetical protein